jgi:hypothetical protein
LLGVSFDGLAFSFGETDSASNTFHKSSGQVLIPLNPEFMLYASGVRGQSVSDLAGDTQIDQLLADVLNLSSIV